MLFIYFELQSSRSPCTDSLSQMMASVIRKQRQKFVIFYNKSQLGQFSQLTMKSDSATSKLLKLSIQLFFRLYTMTVDAIRFPEVL